MVSNKLSLLILYESEYKDRLTSKPSHPGYEQIQSLKDQLFDIREKLSSRLKSEDWSVEELMKVCKDLKNNKARDQLDLIYELFKPQLAGSDVHLSLTKMFNLMKENIEVPNFFESMSITSIYKNKGNRKLLSNDRGIFNLCKVRSVLDKLLYKDIFNVVDNNLSFSNIGGRKFRNIRDHLFVLYGVINDVINGKAESLDIQGVDIIKCFDEMNFEETHNDLYDTKVNDDKFALICKLDENGDVKVKTPCGETNSFPLHKKILQGSTLASLKCAISIDTLGRDSLRDVEGMGLYKYKQMVDVTVLSLVYDVIGFSSCNLDSIKMNSLINSKIESKISVTKYT